uniref:Uncharacterized protein n=1 Tax=Parastrongyloides trichosuri TaxID=131310 RepID=A0A0N4Z3U5_PARTI
MVYFHYIIVLLSTAIFMNCQGINGLFSGSQMARKQNVNPSNLITDGDLRAIADSVVRDRELRKQQRTTPSGEFPIEVLMGMDIQRPDFDLKDAIGVSGRQLIDNFPDQYKPRIGSSVDDDYILANNIDNVKNARSLGSGNL